MKKAQAAEPGALAIVGDKPKAQLSRAMPQAINVTFNGIGKDVPTFVEASAIADEIMQNGGDFDEIRIVSNKYISAISYETHTTAVISAEALRQAAGFQQYEMEEDVSKDLAEFALANAIYTALVEGHCAEISARRQAMENASNVSLRPPWLAMVMVMCHGPSFCPKDNADTLPQNANDMIGSLQLQYNRGRQAVITNELIEIITVSGSAIAIAVAGSAAGMSLIFAGCLGFVSGCRCRLIKSNKNGMQRMAFTCSSTHVGYSKHPCMAHGSIQDLMSTYSVGSS